jgi:adenylylsulfate kinase-like enzyme
MPPGTFIEVFVNAPLAVCEQRDPKGLYAKARKQKIKNFTGITSPYEPPLQPEIELATDRLTVMQAVQKILKLLEKKCRIQAQPGRPPGAIRWSDW